jgi:GTP cyclohydrolase-4
MNTSSSPSTVRPRFADDFYDVPNQPPAVPLALPTVSVRHQQILLEITDDLVGDTQPLLCDVDARVSLGPAQRGIHMSRIQVALQTPTTGSLSDVAVAVAKRIRESQEQEVAEVRLRARVPLMTRTRVTDLPSPDTIEIHASATTGPTPMVRQGVAATNITACPCMQGYSLTDLINELGLSPQDGLDLLSRVPIATHSQRGRVELAVETPHSAQLPGYKRLLGILAERTTLTQELLKRPDEYDLVRRAHLAPQFVEDVVRAVAHGAALSLAGHGDTLQGLAVDITAESYESIHGHDILARLSASAQSLVDGVAHT